jgi:tRNA A-37 threonylcarbamoyl transferase component Bud32
METIYPVASYKDPYFLFSYRDKTVYNFAFTKLVKEVFPAFRGRNLYKILYFLGLEKFFAPSYLFVINNGESNLNKRLLNNKIGKWIDLKKYEPIKVFGNLANFGSASFWLLDKETSVPKYVLKIKRNIIEGDTMDKKIERLLSLNLPYAVLPVKHDKESQLFEFIKGVMPEANNESLEKAISLIKEIHLKNSGLTHGDYTLANILKDSENYRIIDWDDYAEGKNQIFDVCSLVVHFLFILNKNHISNAKETLTSEKVLNWFKKYDNKINKDNLLSIWESFFEYSKEWYKNRRESKYKFYNLLSETLNK